MTSRETVANAQIVGRKIRLARHKAGLSAQELAVLLGVREQTVYRWEQGRHLPSFARLVEVAKRTKTPVSKLLPKSKVAA